MRAFFMCLESLIAGKPGSHILMCEHIQLWELACLR